MQLAGGELGAGIPLDTQQMPGESITDYLERMSQSSPTYPTYPTYATSPVDAAPVAVVPVPTKKSRLAMGIVASFIGGALLYLATR